ncbi:hypothetical protein [Nocardiopsis sp. LDBS1602]|uniref:hypothetical protein n=1 Tax=Nocardiopsis sp. LDBS1602 TaxID=3109597 RepID=UPI002DBC0576|nr:hypothetical protein [Nocardiopsis sp. LDBS1602]MEC3895139.1 hypothetical protein [Nocardiopsis sp. LDBS1602]
MTYDTPGSAARYERANTGPDAERWRTWKGPVVLALARTFTSAARVLEALAVFRGDLRVLVVFSFDGTSAFNAGAEELLEGLETALIPWERRLEVHPHLVLTATENADMADFACPIVVLPHGIGFQKYVPDHRTSRVRLSGVPRPEFHEAGNLHLVLSHPAQLEQLRAARIPLVDRAHVVGDPARDRLIDDLRLRDRYRADLKVEPDQRLVVLTSTWGPEGLIGSRPELPGALVGSLPHDDYRVAAILHPNIWFAHSPWQVRHMLADALDAGLLLMPPDRGWGAALVAADCVIGDHGSVTLYGAALDHPVLVAARGSESVPGTAASALFETAPRLETGDLREQVERVVEGHLPGRNSAATELAFAHPGEGGWRLTALLYRLLDMEPHRSRGDDGTRRALPPPVPDEASATALAFDVHGLLDGAELSLERFPSATRRTPSPPAGAVRHLSVYETEPRHALVHSASVVCRVPGEHVGPAHWPERALERYPGAYAVAQGTGEGTEVLFRGGDRLLVRFDSDVAPTLSAAVPYTLLRAGREPIGHHKVRVGPHRRACSVEPLTRTDS